MGSRNYRSFPRLVPNQPSSDANREADNPWLPLVPPDILLPSHFSGYPRQPRPPMQILVLGNELERQIPPGLIGQQNLLASPPTREQSSRLTADEQRSALQKLKKEFYNPVPKRMMSRVSLYYRDQAKDTVNERRDEEVKRCAVCLEDFEPKEWVMLTPCNHMFHEECIVPWVKSHGQCPVCRYAFYEQRRGNVASSNNNIGNVSDDDLMAEVLRAMEELFIFNNTARRHF